MKLDFCFESNFCASCQIQIELSLNFETDDSTTLNECLLVSQLTCVEIPITKLTFFDLAENRTQDIIAIEEKYKVRVKLQLGALPESGDEAFHILLFNNL